MTKEEKQLLLRDLCERLPYGVMCKLSAKGAKASITEKLDACGLDSFISGMMDVKPFLRPMLSMTSREWMEFYDCSVKDEMSWVIIGNGQKLFPTYNRQDYLNTHHLDYRGLIPAGLAFIAPEGMYEIK